MTADELAQQWLRQAEDLERTASAYKRTCVKGKAVQNILLAKQLRDCAEKVRALELGTQTRKP